MRRRLRLFLPVLLLASILLPLLAGCLGGASQETLGGLDLIEGDGDQELDQPIKRQDMAVLLSRLMQEEDAAREWAGDHLFFKDIEIEGYRSYIAWAVDKNYLSGSSPDRFGFDEGMTLEEIGELFLKILGYKDLENRDSYQKAKDLGLFRNLDRLTATQEISRGELAVLISNALTIEVKGTGEIWAKKLFGRLAADLDEEGGILAFGNEFEIGTVEEFATGIFRNTSIREDIGDGAIGLMKIDGEYPRHGEFISPVIRLPDFHDLVMSWNSDTPEGTYVEVEAKVLVKQPDGDGGEIETWTDWFSWGEWSPHMGRFSKSTSDGLARMGIDVLSVIGFSGEKGSKVQVKVNLHTRDPEISPVVRYLHGTVKNSSQPIEKKFGQEVDLANLDKDIETPEYSQMVREPRTSNSICSPTTITMMMNRYGETLLPDEVAQNTYDISYGFGNWSFAMASAASYGYKAYLDYTTIEGLKYEISQGYPVGVSLSYTNNPRDSRYPYIEGAPGVTPGHLIVVRGFTRIDGEEYIIVNDSFAPEDETVRRLYKLDEFERAWSTTNAAYIIRDKEEGGGTAPTMRLDAEIRATDVEDEYAVYYEDENIDVSNFGGVIAYTLDDDLSYGYFPREAKNSLTFSKEEISNPKLKVYIITDTGKVYIGRYVEEV